MKNNQLLKWIKCCFLLALLSLAMESLYFTWVYNRMPSAIRESRLVVVYSGTDDREGWIRGWAKERVSVLFLFSGADYTIKRLEDTTGLPDSRILLENRANTTDQNARYSAPLIEKSGLKAVVLALPWYHLPRAMFLTRLYLLGADIKVVSYATMPLPPHWFFNRLFWNDMVKFWGSLGRVVLSWIGIDNWPRHF
jgi:uncharacterized SAM-binding protein YcdF (DUF218 family)